MNGSNVIRIDLNQVLKQRLARYYRFIPKGLIKWMERTVCQDKLNALLESNAGKTDADFCRGVLADLNVTYKIDGLEHMDTGDSRVVIVSNHPLGALDGIIMIDFVSRHFNKPVKFIVNDLLMAIKPLGGVFLPINKHGRQSRDSSSLIDNAFSGDEPIIIFPAGLVSRRQGKEVMDLKWQKMFVNKCIQYERNIIPVFFSGENSSFFYNFARLRAKTGLKLNIEMIYLPREVFRCENARFNLNIGRPIAFKKLKGGKEAAREAEAIKRIVYGLR